MIVENPSARRRRRGGVGRGFRIGRWVAGATVPIALFNTAKPVTFVFRFTRGASPAGILLDLGGVGAAAFGVGIDDDDLHIAAGNQTAANAGGVNAAYTGALATAGPIKLAVAVKPHTGQVAAWLNDRLLAVDGGGVFAAASGGAFAAWASAGDGAVGTNLADIARLPIGIVDDAADIEGLYVEAFAGLPRSFR